MDNFKITFLIMIMVIIFALFIADFVDIGSIFGQTSYDAYPVSGFGE